MNHTSTALRKLTAGESQVGPPAGWSVIAGNPVATAWPTYASEDGARTSGIWHSTAGTYRVSYSKWEYFVVTEGACVLTSKDGVETRLKAGDAFVVEPGFEGTWHVTEAMKKYYVFSTVSG